ncbi:serine hydrolase [Nocardia sp. NBC_01388]|uniref:serine hydrolase n=1 Tax=Nocardia sp. NBC_01388 TaxID=2903596 RepID=UPI0032460498
MRSPRGDRHPHRLTDTYLPATGDTGLRGPHPHGYGTVNGIVTDETRSEPSIPWTAGALISTGSDLNRFYLTLLAGQIVAAPQLKEMLSGAPMPGGPFYYGLGIGNTELSCGAEYFGHTGGVAGYVTITGDTREGRAVTIAMTSSPDPAPDSMALLSHALCP